MHHILRLAVLAACLVGLAACNNVVSNEPWFTSADTQGAPHLRDGLWVRFNEEPCRARLERPAERWPDCAAAFYVRGGEWLVMNWDDTTRRKRVFESWESVPIVLARGDPAILQFDAGPEPPAAAPDPDEIVIDDDEPYWRYSYAAMHPTELDSEGRVVALGFWAIQCGPPPQREIKGGVEYPLLSLTEGYATERPFPGLTIVGEKCTAENVDALRRAAVSTREISQIAPARWVREGWH